MSVYLSLRPTEQVGCHWRVCYEYLYWEVSSDWPEMARDSSLATTFQMVKLFDVFLKRQYLM